jgi:lipoprotein-releasing system permease protein
MYKSLPFFIGLRYLRAKRRNHFISFISISSTIGIALGITVLITVLSVLNGFNDQIKNRVLSMATQLSMSTESNFLPDWQQAAKMADTNPNIVASAPYVSGQSMLTANGQVSGAFVFGVLPDLEAKISELGSKMVVGKLNDLQSHGFGVILGSELANNLGVVPGDKILLISPVASMTPFGIIPRSKRFTVVGIFDAGSGFGFNDKFAYIHLDDAKTFYNTGDAVSGLRFKLKDAYQAPWVENQLANVFPENYVFSDWTTEYGSFFEGLALQKTMMAVILFLIIAVAIFNLVSSLVMTVTDKASDIAILRTLGATPRQIMAIFMVQGSMIGLLGTFIGLLCGILLSMHVTQLYLLVKHVFHLQLLTSGVFYVDYLPSEIMASDVLRICVIAVIMSFLANLYPAWRASKTHPVEALRYE